MKKVKTVILLLLFSLCFLTSFAQQDKQQVQHNLAVQFYSNGELDKAAEIFESLYKKTKSEEYYEYLYQCYTQLKNFKDAEKLTEKKVKDFPQNAIYQIDLGNIYSLQEEEKKANKAFEKALSLMTPDNQEIIFIARRFQKRKKDEWAIQTYLKGRKLINNDYPFSFELADIYRSQNKFTEMVNEYLFVLEYGRYYLDDVETALSTAIGEDIGGKKKQILKEALLKKIQEKPDNDLYLEVLIWEYLQEKNFSAAFVQMKAIDKRKKEEGYRLLLLSDLAAKNNDYETATKALQYVIDLGKNNMYYLQAKTKYLYVLTQKITTRSDYTSNDLTQLDEAYKNTIKELGKNRYTIDLLKDHAHLQAFYLHQNKIAIKTLKDAINIGDATQRQVADSKLELGDVYLISDSIWEASLLYSQVDLDFKNEIIGQDARYRNAKISYYTGDFKWAKAQLDVLKSATDRLIANDAMYLSILITDNTLLDTITTPLEMFARADLMEFQNKDSLCLLTLDSLEKEYKSRYNLMDDVMYKRAEIAIKKHQYTEAANYLQKTYEYKDLLADDALFKLAELYETVLNDKAKAQEKYQEIMFKFPGSIYVEEARKRFRTLRGDEKF